MPLKPKVTRKIHQLTDMEIHEVSLVDHAANRRRFLIAKRSESLPELSTDVAEAPQGTEANPAPSEALSTTQVQPDDTHALLREVIAALKASTQLAQAHVATPLPVQAPREPQPDAAAMEVAKVLHQRLVRLEKHFGLPQSLAPEAPPARPQHVWPFDINRPVEADEGAASSAREAL